MRKSQNQYNTVDAFEQPIQIISERPKMVKSSDVVSSSRSKSLPNNRPFLGDKRRSKTPVLECTPIFTTRERESLPSKLILNSRHQHNPSGLGQAQSQQRKNFNSSLQMQGYSRELSGVTVQKPMTKDTSNLNTFRINGSQASVAEGQANGFNEPTNPNSQDLA